MKKAWKLEMCGVSGGVVFEKKAVKKERGKYRICFGE